MLINKINNYIRRNLFKTDAKRYLKIPSNVVIDLINKHSDTVDKEKLERGFYGATGIYKYTNGDKTEEVFTNGHYIWSTVDPTPISEYVYVPMNSLTKLDEETILKSFVSLERVVYGTNYDYVVYKKALASYEKTDDYDAYEEETAYFDYYEHSMLDQLTAIGHFHSGYGQVTINDDVIKNEMPESNMDLYCKINITYKDDKPDINIEKTDGTVIKVDETWNLYKKLENIEPFNVKATYLVPFTSVFENELQERYDEVKDKADDRLFTWGIILLIACILTLVIIIMLPKKTEEYTVFENFFDNLWFEIFIGIDTILYVFTYAWFYDYIIDMEDYNKTLAMKVGCAAIIACCILTYMTVMTFMRRIAKKSFIKSLLMYIPFRLFGKAAGVLNREVNRSAENIIDKKFKKKGIIKLRIILVAMFYIINGILGLTFITSADSDMEDLSCVIFVVFNIYVVLKCIKNAINEQDIVNGIAVIASGKLDHRISTEHMKKIEKDVAENVNNIGKGLEYAVEDSIKAAKKSVNDERLKAELITNVSHDIKTPLTSIINYVDLLKREHIDNPKCEEYINVLEKKSYRLKMLIEDLVEASKITTGNITLYMERINLNELLNQVLGEYDDKFSEKNLMVDTEYYREPLYISADGRRIFRVVDNLLQNVYKYSQENTRVYVKLLSNGTNAKIIIKNTSKAKLDIDPEELKERFKRGDESRSSEGNGLGLSIADSLVTLMSGTMQLFIDGDLFKVEVTFPINNDVKINVIEGNLIENCPKSAAEPEEPEEPEYTEVAETPNELMNVDMYNLNEIEDDSNKRILEDKQGSYMIESDDNK
ncbi:MAG: HAMP domain-containing histidine kinase [Lachnospiraceae bacterium]|nr:HAMP domain-containing histidine kinase [Lachnospiraceae bacterium]